MLRDPLPAFGRISPYRSQALSGPNLHIVVSILSAFPGRVLVHAQLELLPDRRRLSEQDSRSRQQFSHAIPNPLPNCRSGNHAFEQAKISVNGKVPVGDFNRAFDWCTSDSHLG
jgi:hypothetical protein